MFRDKGTTAPGFVKEPTDRIDGILAERPDMSAKDAGKFVDDLLKPNTQESQQQQQLSPTPTPAPPQ